MRMRCRRSGVLAVVLVLVAVGCSDSDGDGAGTDTTGEPTTTTVAATTGTTAPGEPQVVVFNGQGNNLDAYAAEAPFRTQRVNRAFSPEEPDEPNPDGTDINAQICFFPDGSGRFIAGEDRGQGEGDLQGWGIFQLTGDAIGDFGIDEVAKLVPTFQNAGDNAENYGCGVLSDGRVVTTDIGNQASGDPNGQLIVWFPPFEGEKVAYCKVDVAIATAQSVLVEADDSVLVASARASDLPGATGAGVWRYGPGLPTGPDAAGGCGRTDGTGAPLADEGSVTKELFVATGEHGLATPAGLAPAPGGNVYVSSVFTGVINEYDADGGFVRTVLAPPEGEQLGPEPYSTGTPLGLGVAPDGSLFYADIGIVVSPDDGVGPGERTGTVRRIGFVDGEPQPPETMATGLAYPDGIGVHVPQP